MITIGINIGIAETERKNIGIISNLKSVVSPIPTTKSVLAHKLNLFNQLKIIEPERY